MIETSLNLTNDSYERLLMSIIQISLESPQLNILMDLIEDSLGFIENICWNDLETGEVHCDWVSIIQG